jgi:magnesium-transporting ATPase (P-type)
MLRPCGGLYTGCGRNTHADPGGGSDLLAMVEQESAQGLHILLFTYAPVLVSLLNASDTPTLPYELIPLGLISLSDQLCSQAHETRRQLSHADIRFKVICGDHL